jgi:CRP-like cAMP-binding protein
VKHERFSKLAANFGIIQNNFSEQTREKLIDVLEERFYMPNQVIFVEKTYSEPMIYMVLKGKIEIFKYAKGENTHICYVEKGSYFGKKKKKIIFL